MNIKGPIFSLRACGAVVIHAGVVTRKWRSARGGYACAEGLQWAN